MGWEGDELSVVFITQSAFFLLLWLEHHSGPQLSRTGPLVLFRQTFFFFKPLTVTYIYCITQGTKFKEKEECYTSGCYLKGTDVLAQG